MNLCENFSFMGNGIFEAARSNVVGVYLKVDRGRDVAALEVHTALLSNEDDGAFISTHFFRKRTGTSWLTVRPPLTR